MSLGVPGQASVAAMSRARILVIRYASRAPARRAVGPTSTSPSIRRVRWTPRNGRRGSGTGGEGEVPPPRLDPGALARARHSPSRALQVTPESGGDLAVVDDPRAGG